MLPAQELRPSLGGGADPLRGSQFTVDQKLGLTKEGSPAFGKRTARCKLPMTTRAPAS
jgi:hypothetical protein